MRKISLILLTVFTLMDFATAQLPPWNFVVTAHIDTIVISGLIYSSPVVLPNDTVFSGSDTLLQTGDYLGVFYTRNDTDYCAGYTLWDISHSRDSVFYAYGNDTVHGGFKNFETFKFHIWKSSAKCQISDVNVTYQAESLNQPGVFIDETSCTINGISANSDEVYYPSRLICQNSGQVKAIEKNGLNDIVYKSGAGLSIDSLTGTINSGHSVAGTYLVTLKTAYCLSADTLQIKILPLPDAGLMKDTTICRVPVLLQATSGLKKYLWSDNETTRGISVSNPGIYSVTVTDSNGCQSAEDTINVFLNPDAINISTYSIGTVDENCEQKGSLTLNDGNNGNSNKIFSVSILNLINKDTVYNEIPITELINTGSNGQLYSAPLIEGSYSLEFFNNYGCSAIWKDTISVKLDCNNKYPVLTPDVPGNEDIYLINLNGQVRIYNKYGIIVAEFLAPYYWDGRDSNGAELPMGTYLITDGKGNYINITIIR